MTAKSIPEVGEVFTGYVPGIQKTLHVTFGPDTTADVVITDCGIYTLVDVNMPMIVWNAKLRIETAFTASATMTLGDSADVDRYMDATAVGDTVIDTAFQADSLAAPFWDTAGLDIQAVVAGATPAVGLAHLFVTYTTLDD